MAYVSLGAAEGGPRPKDPPERFGEVAQGRGTRDAVRAARGTALGAWRETRSLEAAPGASSRIKLNRAAPTFKGRQASGRRSSGADKRLAGTSIGEFETLARAVALRISDLVCRARH